MRHHNSSPPAPTIQLEMVAFVGGRPSVLVMAIDEIDYTQFRTLLSKAGVRYIVDLRSSPSFYGRGFRREAVEALLRQNGIAYAGCRICWAGGGMRPVICRLAGLRALASPLRSWVSCERSVR